MMISVAPATTVTLTSGTSVGSTVSVGGTAIGTIAAGGTGTDNLIVTFNSNAMPAAVSTLIQALTYFDSSTNNPTPLQRTIAVTVNDGLTGTDTENVLSAPTSPRNTAPAESRELVDRLLSQVEALKSEVRELTEAQQQPAHAIAAIEAEHECAERRSYTGTQTPLRCRPSPRADLSRGASCRFRDGQRAHVLHCVRCSRATLFCAILSDVHM